MPEDREMFLIFLRPLNRLGAAYMVTGSAASMAYGVPRVTLTDPLEYDVFVHLMAASTLILTDSGGIQEEAPALGKPVLLLRKETERPEAVDAGAVRLVGPDEARIVREAERLLHEPDLYARMSCVVSPFGDGHAAERIGKVILEGRR